MKEAWMAKSFKVMDGFTVPFNNISMENLIKIRWMAVVIR